MTTRVYFPGCCAFDIIHTLNEGVENFLTRGVDVNPEFANEYPNKIDGHGYVFTDTVNGPGSKIAKFLKKKKLGTVDSLKSFRNSGSGKRVKLWVFRPNLKKVAEYLRDN